MGTLTGQGPLLLTELNPFKGWLINTHSIFYGVAACLTLIFCSLIITLTYEPFKRALVEIDNLLLNKIKYVDILPIALLSGFAEELFFRGILQEEYGIIFTSICFAVLHFPGRNFWIYSLWALFASLFLGNIYAYTHNLFIVVFSHTLNNLFALLLWQRFKDKISKNIINN